MIYLSDSKISKVCTKGFQKTGQPSPYDLQLIFYRGMKFDEKCKKSQKSPILAKNAKIANFRVTITFELKVAERWWTRHLKA